MSLTGPRNREIRCAGCDEPYTAGHVCPNIGTRLEMRLRAAEAELEEANRKLGQEQLFRQRLQVRFAEAERQVKELQELVASMRQTLRTAPDTRLAHFRLRIEAAVAGSVEEQKPLSHLRTTWDKVAEEQKP